MQVLLNGISHKHNIVLLVFCGCEVITVPATTTTLAVTEAAKDVSTPFAGPSAAAIAVPTVSYTHLTLPTILRV